MMDFNPIEYKKKSITNWNQVAEIYHNKWAGLGVGPFGSTKKVIELADINKNDIILDLACGTGALSADIGSILQHNGKLIGIDLSRNALSISKKQVHFHNSCFIEMDMENIAFSIKFSKVLCQYGLMFLTNPISSLLSIRNSMMQNGKLVVAVHGLSKNVPYFSCIMDEIQRNYPDIIPKNSPSVHSFGDGKKLINLLKDVNFEDIQMTKCIFQYTAGKFLDYWNNYINCTANSIKEIIKKDKRKYLQVKNNARENVQQYLKNNIIIFPWEIIIITALNKN